MPLNPGDPIFNGTSGPDSFGAPSGNSGINGFGGTDTVTFSFNLVDAVISYSGPVVIIDTATSHTELTGIETYHFADGTVSEDDDTPLVADLYYYGTYHDIWNAGADADLHYNGSGWHEHRNPNPFFNTDFYLSLYQDTAGLNPLTHYSTTGWTLGRIPSPLFDPAKYKAAYPDVAAAGIDPLLHFLTSGVEEGRVPFPVTTITSPNGFDALYYLTHYPDVAAAHADPFLHFMTSGWHEGRNPNAYFDTRGYLATYVDVAMAGVNPLDHFHNNGWKEGRNPSPGFDSQQYLAVYTDVAAAGVDPLAHFLSYGINEGRVAFPEPIFDTNGAADTVLEGAAAGTGVGITASWGGWISPALSFSISSDSSGGGFGVNAITGQIVVTDSTKLDFETSGASHSYVVTVVARDGELSHSQTFTVGIGDVIPTTPVDGNAGANTVVEGAANGSTVGVTLFSNEPNGPPVVYELTDTAGGRFAVDSSTGVVTVANSGLLDFETGAHSFTITGRTQVGAVFTPTQSFTINLTNANPSPISDSNVANETVDEGAAVNTLVGIDADSTDPNGPAVIWSITSDSSGGGFKIDSNGVVSVADASKIDYEGAPGVGHSYSIIVQASDGVGGVTSRNFSIVVNNLNPTTPVEVNDGTPGGSVTEGAAVNTLVGIDVNATDVNGPPVTWSITNDPSGGGFKIDSNGVISVANAGLIDFEGAGATHTYALTVQAADGDGGTSSAVFNVVVGNIAPTTPVEVADGTAGGNVSEGASNGALVGLTASSTDINGPPVIWTITNDTSDLGSGGAFTINSSGVVSVADATKLNYETAPGVGRSYDVTVQASDGFASNSAVFNILVGNVNPQTPADGDPTNDAVGIQGQIVEGAAAATGVGIDANSLDPNGPPVSWSILSGSASGAFQIDASGVVTVLNGALLNFETAPSLGGGKFGHTILVQASDGAGGTSTQTFTIELTNAAPAAPSDTDPVGDGAGTIKGIATFDALANTQVGIDALSSDPAGGAVTFELTGASSPFFQIDASTGVVTVSATGQGNLVAGTDYDIFVVAKDSTGLVSGTSSASQFTVRIQGLAPGAPFDGDGAIDNEVLEGAPGIPGNFAGSTYTGIDANSTTAGVTFSLIADSSGGGFQIDTDGKIYVADGSLIDFESAPLNKYTVTVQASDGSLTSSSNFDIFVLDVAPTQPIDGDPSAGVLADPVQGRVTFNAANGANVGITVLSTDVNGGTLFYELTDDEGGRFTIDQASGVVTLAAGHPALLAGEIFTITARANDGTVGTPNLYSLARDFVIEIVSNQPVVDLNGVGDGGIDFSNSFAEDGADAAITDTDAAIVYAGFTNLTSATITLTNAQVGDALAVVTPGALTVNTVTGGGKITVTLSGNQPFSVYETALRSITFENTSDTPVTGDRIITVVVSDGVNPPSNAATSTITVSATNDTPTLNLTLPDLVTTPYQENAAPVALATAGSITDPDAPVNFNGGRYTVEITNDSAGDQIVLLASSGFSASGSSIIYGGVEIGTILAGTALGTEKVTIVLDADATPVVVNALSTAFAYRNVSENPADGALNDRTIDFTFQDGGNTGAAAPGASSNTETQTIRVTAVNDAPVNLVPAGTPGVGTGGTFTFNGANTISITDVDGGANEEVTLSVTSGTLTLSGIAGLTFSGGADGTADATMTFTGSVTDINNALNGLVYNAPGTAGAVTLTITTDDNGNTGTPGALTDTDMVTINVSASDLTGQLWYVTRDGLATDNWVGRLNSDGTAITPVLDTLAINEKDIALDTSAGLFFVVDGLGLVSYNSDGTVADNTLDLSAYLSVDAVALDPVYGVLFVSVTSLDTATTGILQIAYDPVTGALTDTGDFLVNQDTVATYINAVDFSIDVGNRQLYYVDSSIPDSNGIYVVDYDGGSSPANTADAIPPTAALLSDSAAAAAQFLFDGSTGTIVALAVDNLGNNDATDDVIYFLTSDGAGGTNELWYIDRDSGTPTTATVVTGVTLTAETIHTGLSFDSVSNSLFISDQGTSILQAHLSAIGNVDTITHTYTTTQLIGHAPVGTPVPGATAFDTLPVATVHDTAFSEGTPILVDPALTISDPDVFLTGVTITITGGFAGNGDTLSFDTTGTAITGPASPVAADGSGNITLTLTGRDTLANYQGVLVNTLTFNSGDNPTNFGTNPTRTVTWHFDDGAAGDPHSTGNTKTSTITIADANDAPTLDLDAVNVGSLDFTASYQVGDPAVAVTGTVDITDLDTATIQFATVTLTNAQAGDILAINGALPAGITSAIVIDTVADPDTITVTLTGPASLAAFETALQQVVFSSSSSDLATVRTIDIAVDDGQGVPHLSNVAQTTINLAGNTSPVAQDDDAAATEAGGLNNAVAGSNPSGNVFADNGNGVDLDAEDAPAGAPGAGVVVTQVTHSVNGTVLAGTTIIGTYGAVTINADGTYSYSIDQSNAAVQALVPAGAVLHDIFTYTIRDTFGATDTAVLDITINGADDLAAAFVDIGSMSEDAVPTVFTPRANDTLDPDAPATNAVTLQPGAAAAGNGAANGLGIDIGDVTLSVNASNQIEVALTGSDFQKLAVGDTATITIPYRLAGDTQNSDSTLTVTVNGANDLPVANDDTGSMTEDAATTPFIVLTGAGADVLDVDRGAPIASTVGLVTTGTVTAVGNGTASGKGIDGADVTVGVNASNEITVALGADFHKLTASETATITVAYLLHGDGADTDGANLTVTVNGVNDAPVVDLLNTAGVQTTGITATFTENGPAPPSVPVNVLPQVTLSDVDGTTLTGAIVTLTNAQVGVDVLTLQGEAGPSGTLANGIGYAITSNNTVVTFTGTDSVSDYQDALKLIQFNNASDNPTQADRTFTVQVNDGAATNAATTATLDFVAVNDAPVNTVPGTQSPVFSDTDYAVTGVSVVDLDAGAGLIRTTLNAVSGDLSVSLAGGATVFSGANGTSDFVLQGTVTQINAALATLKYNSDTGFIGPDTITVSTNDQGNSPAPAQSDLNDTISIGVVPKVWFIDNTPGAVDAGAPLGSQTNPFTSIAAFNAATTGLATNEYVYLREGTYTENNGIVLKNGQTLIGQGEDLSVPNPFAAGNITIETGSAGQTPVIALNGAVAGAMGIDLAQNNTVKGLNVTTSLGTQSGIDDGSNSVGTLNVSNIDVTGVGKAIDIDQGGTFNTFTIDNLSSTGSGSQGIDLGGGLTGTMTIGTGAISGQTGGAGFNLAGGGSLNVTFNGGISQASANALVSVSGGHTGTMTFQNGTLSATNGSGFQFDNADGTYHLNGTNTLNGGDAGIDILNTSIGTFNFQQAGGGANTTITNPSGTAFNLLNSNANVIYSGTITDNTGSAVTIDNHDAGTITFQNGSITSTGSGITVQNNGAGTVNFNNATIALTTGANAGVTLAGNTGSAINFNLASGGNGLDITTTSGAGFNATGGGTVTVLDPSGAASNTITAGSGVGLNITGTEIGSGHVTFEKISSGGGANNGITLDGTGTAAGNGGLHITGTGVAGSGGTIANKTGANGSTTGGIGIYVNNTKDVQLDWMQLNDLGNFAIRASDVNGFSLQNSVINGNNGNDAGSDEGAIFFANSSGTIAIANSLISGGFEDNLRVVYDSATPDTAIYNITNNDFTDLQSGNNALVNLRSTTTASASSNVTFNFGSTSDSALGNLFDNSANQNPAGPPATQWFGDGFLVTFEGGFQHTINIDNNTFFELFQAIDFAAGFSADVNARIYNNTITYTEGVGAIAFGTASTSTAAMLFQMLIEDNDIGGLGNNSGSRLGSGIVGDFRGAETARVTIHQNVVRDTEVNPINIISQMTLGQDGDTHLRITNNTVASIDDDEGGGAGIIPGIQVTTNAATNGDIFLTLTGNTSTGINEEGVLIRQATANNTFQIEDLVPASGGTGPQVEAFLEALNTSTVRVRTGGSVVQYTAMNNNNTNTPAPVTPLLAADGGIASATGATGDHDLTLPELAGTIEAAIDRWVAAGLTGDGLAALDHLQFVVGDLGGSNLGLTLPGLILIDDDAAGKGWFIDANPLDDSEFGHALSATQLRTDPLGAPAGQMDLLTVVMHEIGHALGLEHDPDGDSLMSEQLVTGERRVPGVDAAGAGPMLVSPEPVEPAEAAFIGSNIVNGFDAEYYLAQYADVAAAGIDPLLHFEMYGWQEGRNPNALFDTAGYLEHYADVAAAGINPLVHYHEYGWQEGRDPSASFDTAGYLATYADVAAAHVDPLDHFLKNGIHEGRSSINDGLWGT